MPVRFEPDRVTAVWAPGQPTGMVGSGYLLDAGLVLTAGHVVDHADGRACEVRPLGTREWLATEPIWRSEHCDAALLRVQDGCHGGDAATRLGRVGGDERVACRALGFPFAQAKEGGEVRDTEDLAGEIAPLTGHESKRLTVHIAGSVPTPDRSGHSPWEGMSGAALFSGPLIVGVIVIDPAHFGTDRLEAVPITAMIAEPDFRAALTGDADTTLALQAVEDVDAAGGVLRAPYGPLPGQATPERLRRGASHFLVAAKYGVVPFHGRSGELEELGGWCAQQAGLQLGLLLGPGGSGKTRLAAEVCRRTLTAGGLAGFLVPDAPLERLAALGEVTGPLLAVVDEAPTRIDQIASLLFTLADEPFGSPVRVLLLARRAGEWWDRLLPERLGQSDAGWAHSTATVRELSAVDQGATARELAFRAAAAAFAPRIGRAAEELRLPVLEQPVFEQILFVHLAALSALEGESAGHARPIRDDLLQFALKRESRYWTETANASGLAMSHVVCERAVALATLTVAASEDDAAAALSAVPDLADAPQERRRNVARWLRDLYPAEPASSQGPEPPWFRQLTPAPLGEALVAQMLQTAPGLPTRLLDTADAAQANRALTVLTQTAREHPSAEGALRRTLADHLATHWEVFLAVAQQSGDPLGRVLAAVLDHTPDPALAVEIERALPQDTVALREFAVIASRQAVERTLDQPPGRDRDTQVARLFNHQSIRLSALGRHEDALAASEQAVKIRQRLVEQDPDAFLPDLAMSLNNESNALTALGRREDALAAIEQAVEIHRRLAEEHRDEYLPYLAGSLSNQANGLGAVGRREDALAASEQAVEIYGRLAEERPDTFLPDLAGSLSNQANGLSALGRHEDALAAIEQAAEIYRRLAQERPDAFQPDLAMSLTNRSGALGALGRHEDALAASEQAVKIYGRLAEERPDAFLPDLAMSLTNRSGALSALGRREDALAASEQAVEIYRRLAESRADRFLPMLAVSLKNMSKLAADVGRRQDALTLIERAVEISRQLAEQRPDAFLPDLASSLNNLSAALNALGRREDALAVIEQAVEIRRRLAEQRPDAFLPDLATSLTNQSNGLGALGRREDALAAIEEAVKIYRRLAEQRPDAILPDLATSLNNQSNRLNALGRREDALAAIEQAVKIRQRLAKKRPDAFLPDLAGSLNNQARALSALGRREDALATIEQAVNIRRRLAEQRPDVFLPDLAMSLSNMSGGLRALGRHEDALKAVQEAIQRVLPMLEHASYLLPDSGLRLVEQYLELCEQLEREPNQELIQRMYAVLVSAGIPTPEDEATGE